MILRTQTYYKHSLPYHKTITTLHAGCGWGQFAKLAEHPGERWRLRFRFRTVERFRVLSDGRVRQLSNSTGLRAAVCESSRNGESPVGRKWQWGKDGKCARRAGQKPGRDKGIPRGLPPVMAAFVPAKQARAAGFVGLPPLPRRFPLPRLLLLSRFRLPFSCWKRCGRKHVSLLPCTIIKGSFRRGAPPWRARQAQALAG